MDEGVNEDSSSFQSVKELFYSCLPFYLSIGMSAYEFWEGDPELAVAYRKADELKRENTNLTAWLNGMYVYKALLCASPMFHDFVKEGVKPIPYEDPVPITKQAQERKEEQEKKKAYDEMRAYIEGFMSKQKRKE